MNCEPDWVAIQCVERDILLAYHQLSEHGYIMGDFYWESVFTLPYWDYLQVNTDEPERDAFVRNGCLILILALAFDTLDESGDHLADKYSACRAAVRGLQVSDERSRTLLCTVVRALEAVKNPEQHDEALEASSRQVFEEHVKSYFLTMAQNLA